MRKERCRRCGGSRTEGYEAPDPGSLGDRWYDTPGHGGDPIPCYRCNGTGQESETST